MTQGKGQRFVLLEAHSFTRFATIHGSSLSMYCISVPSPSLSWWTRERAWTRATSGAGRYTGDGTEDAGRNEAHHLGAVVALVKRGANVGARNAKDETAVARAEAAGNRAIAKYLREAGAA